MPLPGEKSYDNFLVDAIARGAYIQDAKEIRPVPEEVEEHSFDPRVLDITRQRIAGLIPNSSDEGLMQQRHSMKETHFITPNDVTLSFPILDFSDRGIPATIITPNNVHSPAPVLLYEHGGSFVGGWFGKYEAFLCAVAEMAGCVVVFPEVRLAPENRFPAQVDDCEQTLLWICAYADELGVDPHKIVVAGDSAGGSLTHATCLRRPNNVALAISLYPVCDISGIPDWWSYDLYPVVEDQRDAMLERVDRLKNWIGDTSYVGPHTSLLKHPEISAVYASNEELAAFPRTVIVCCEYDYLRPQNERFAAQLKAAGVDVRLICYAGMEHGFIERVGVYPQAEDLACIICEEIAKLSL